MLALKVENLRKTFSETVAVEDISFSAAPGEIFGLLDLTARAKSTTLNCVCALLPPTAGRVFIMDRDMSTAGPDARRALGVVPQDLALYEDLDARENLEYWGGASGMRGSDLRTRAQEILSSIELLDRAKEPVKNSAEA